MLIRKVVLHNYKRFFISGVNHFEYTPDQNITIVAWANGLGKSSLLTQLSPLPADLKKDYKEGGYKYLEIEHNGSIYISSSGYVSKNKHSLIKDGVELNHSGTLSLQRSLVEEHFKLTPSIYNILLGTETLSNMRPIIRKQWFTMLSPIDYAFSIKVWNNLKSRYRDLIGSIKILQDDLIKKSNDKIPEDELKAYNKKVKELDIFITEVSQQLVHVEEINNKYDKNKIESILTGYTKQQRKVNSLIESIGNLDNNKYEYKLGEYESLLKNIEEELNNKAKVISLLDKLKDKEGLDSAKEELSLLKNSIKDYNIPNGVSIGTSELIYNKLLSIDNELSYIVNTLTEPNMSKVGNRSTLLEIQQSIDSYKEVYVKLKTKKQLLENDIKDLTNEAGVSTSCPKCNHVFKHDPSSTILSKSKEVNTIASNLENIKDKVSKALVNKKLIESKIELTDKLASLLSDSLLKPFIKDIDVSNPNTIMTVINRAKSEIDVFIKYEKIVDKIENIKKQISIKEEANILVKKYGVNSIDSLEKDIVDITNRKKSILVKIQNLKELILTEKKIQDIISSLKDYQEHEKKRYKYLINSKRNELLLDSIGRLKLELSTIQKKIQQSNNDNTLIESLQATINSNKQKVSVLSKMLTALSPDGGLIAKSINSFLNIFLEEMNTIINSVWNYSMELLPCEVDDENDLNYKFRVKVNDDEIISDVSELSSSMQEIVNLAFKIVFIKYSGLNSFPLLLDEFGRTMDPEHRVAAYDIIDRVLSHNFNQIVLICHFESMYSRFNNADFLELKEYKNSLNN